MICSKFMFRRRTMFVKKVYNFQVDQVWSVQVGVVETFDHLISDDYVNLLFICWGLFNFFSNHFMATLHLLPHHFPLLKTFLEATWCSNSGLRSLYPATMVGQRASFGPCSAFTVAQLTIWSGQKYYTITGVTHNYYRLVLISNPFIAKWIVRRESSLTNSRPRGFLLLLCL